MQKPTPHSAVEDKIEALVPRLSEGVIGRLRVGVEVPVSLKVDFPRNLIVHKKYHFGRGPDELVIVKVGGQVMFTDWAGAIERVGKGDALVTVVRPLVAEVQG